MGIFQSHDSHEEVVHRTIGPSDAELELERQRMVAAQQAAAAAEQAAQQRFAEAVAQLNADNHHAIEALRVKIRQEMESEVERKTCEALKIAESERKAAVEAFWKGIDAEQEEVRAAAAAAAAHFRSTNAMIDAADLVVDWSAQPLGEGAFGKVFRGKLKSKDAKQQTTLIPVAIKRYFAGAPDCPKAINSLKTEARALSALSHPNIAQMLGVYQHTDKPASAAVSAGKPPPESLSLCLVLEYVNGSDLFSLLHADGKRWSPRQTLEIAVQIAGALKHMYAQKIACRDVKSSNVMIAGLQTVKIVDFGLAAHFGTHAKVNASRTSTANRKVDRLTKKTVGKTQLFVAAQECGTLPYTAPELFFGAAKHALADLEKCDVYSFGVTLNELCGAGVPFIDEKSGEPEFDNETALRLAVGNEGFRPAEAAGASGAAAHSRVLASRPASPPDVRADRDSTGSDARANTGDGRSSSFGGHPHTRAVEGSSNGAYHRSHGDRLEGGTSEPVGNQNICVERRPCDAEGTCSEPGVCGHRKGRQNKIRYRCEGGHRRTTEAAADGGDI